MKCLRILGLTLMAVFALGGVTAATASATEVEIGVLTLSALEKLEVKQETKNEALANVGKLVTAGGTISCKKVWVLPDPVTRVDGKHWTLIKDVDLHLSECKFGGSLACNTEGDAKEVLLLLADEHFVVFVIGGQLVAGITYSILNSKLESSSIVLLCGGVSIELKGVMTAKAVQLTEALKEETGEAETKPFTIKAEPGLKCDEVDKSCKGLLEPNPLLVNTGSGFEAATETTEATPMTFSADVLWDK